MELSSTDGRAFGIVIDRRAMTPVDACASSTPRAMPRREVGAKTIGAAVVALAPARAVRARETIEIVDDVLGSGVEPVRGIDVVRVNYETRIADGGRVDAGKFFVFGVGAGEVVRGFDALVAGDESTPAMRAGGKRRAIVPASMAYGQRGAGCDKDGNNCRIPPGSDLEFYVELLEVK